jgi:hypothetical protein
LNELSVDYDRELVKRKLELIFNYFNLLCCVYPPPEGRGFTQRI